MGFFRTLAQTSAAPQVQRDAGPSAQAREAGFYHGAMGGSIASTTGVSVSQYTAMTHSAVWAAVTIQSQDVARCRPALYTEQEDGTRTFIKDHPLLKLFKRPNGLQTWMEYQTQMHMSLMLRGNAYAVKLLDSAGNIRALVPLNPDTVMPVEAVDGTIFYSVTRQGPYLMNLLGKLPFMIPQEFILHARGPTFNMIMAPSTVVFARDAIGLALGLEQQSGRWIANGGQPSGVLTSPKKLTADAADRLRVRWNMFQQGINRVGNTVVLEEGLKYETIAFNAQSMELNAQRNFQIAEIARFFNMPMTKLGIESTVRVPTVEKEQQYVNTSIVPAVELWEQTYALHLDLIDDDINVFMNTALLLRADILSRRNAQRLAVLTGIMTPNEARAEEGWAPKEGADVLLTPANTAALGSDATGTAPDGAGKPAAGNAPTPSVDTNGDGGGGAIATDGESEE